MSINIELKTLTLYVLSTRVHVHTRCMCKKILMKFIEKVIKLNDRDGKKR